MHQRPVHSQAGIVLREDELKLSGNFLILRTKFISFLMGHEGIQFKMKRLILRKVVNFFEKYVW